MVNRKPLAGRFGIPAALVFGGFLFAAGFLLFEEHRAHMLGAIPWLLILLCPLLHLLMPSHHGGGHGHETVLAGMRKRGKLAKPSRMVSKVSSQMGSVWASGA